MQPPQETRTGSGNALTEKVGGFPVWGWLGLAAAGGVVALLWIQRRNASSSGGSSTDTTTNSGNVPDYTGSINALAAQIRDLQGNPSTPVAGAPGGTSTQTQKVLVTEGQSVTDFLKQYGVDLPTLLSLNPGIESIIKQTNNYGYVGPNNPAGPNRGTVGMAFNTGGPAQVVFVPVPATATPQVSGVTTGGVNGVHAIG